MARETNQEPEEMEQRRRRRREIAAKIGKTAIRAAILAPQVYYTYQGVRAGMFFGKRYASNVKDDFRRYASYVRNKRAGGRAASDALRV